MSVDGAESGRYFWTAHTVRTGHVANFLFFISFRSVCLGGLNAASWIYLMSDDLDDMVYALYAMCLVWPVFVSVLVLLYS